MVSQFSDGMKEYRLSDEERHFWREYLSLGVPPLIGAQDMLIDYKPRAYALGYAGVSPLQGSFTSFQSIHFMRPLHNTALAALLSTFRLGHLQE